MEFHVDLYVMPLAGYDMVLRTQWMATLGPIVWDLTARTMAFQQKGRDICWRGVAPRSPAGVHSVVSTVSLLDGLLSSFPDVFTELENASVHGRWDIIVLQIGKSVRDSIQNKQVI
jgi:hypothetical protein